MSGGEIWGVILAGGQGRRMGGVDKAALMLGGETLAARAARRLAPQVPRIALNSNADAGAFAALGLPVLPDTLPDRPGPLAGVLAGLRWAAAGGADGIVTVATDTPFFPGDLVARLRAAGADLALAETADGPHPVFGLWPVRLADDLAAALQRGTRKILDWTGRHGARHVDFPDEAAFFNVNRPEDLRAAEARLGAR